MSEKRAESKEALKAKTLDSALEISEILNTGLDRDQLDACIELIKLGVNPEALAAGIKDLRKETDKQAPDCGSQYSTNRSRQTNNPLVQSAQAAATSEQR